MSNRKSFIMYIDSLAILDVLTDEQAGRLFRMIRDYHLGNELENDPLIQIAFVSFKNAFVRDGEKYEEKVVRRNQLNGLKGGRPKNNKEKPSGLKKTQHNPKNPDNVIDNVNANVNVIGNDIVNGNVNDNVNDINNSLSVINHGGGLVINSKDQYLELLEMINSSTGRKFRGDSKSKRSFYARIKQGWTMDQFRKAIENATASQYHIESNFQYITPEFITREDKLDKFNAGTSNAAPSNRRIVGKTTEQDIRNNFEHFKELWAQTKNNENQ